MRLAIEKMTGSELNGRKVRCKKAVNPDKLEETILKREKGISEKKEAAKLAKAAKLESKENDELIALKDFENAYASDDSYDKIVKLKEKSKKIKKDSGIADGIAEHIAKIARKGETAGKKEKEEGIDITPRLAFKKADQRKVNLQKIKN